MKTSPPAYHRVVCFRVYDKFSNLQRTRNAGIVPPARHDSCTGGRAAALPSSARGPIDPRPAPLHPRGPQSSDETMAIMAGLAARGGGVTVPVLAGGGLIRTVSAGRSFASLILRPYRYLWGWGRGAHPLPPPSPRVALTSWPGKSGTEPPSSGAHPEVRSGRTAGRVRTIHKNLSVITTIYRDRSYDGDEERCPLITSSLRSSSTRPALSARDPGMNPAC